MKKLYYLAWIPFFLFVLGLIAVGLGKDWGKWFLLPLLLIFAVAIFGRKLGGARCIKCGKKLPPNSSIIDYCLECGKKIAKPY